MTVLKARATGRVHYVGGVSCRAVARLAALAGIVAISFSAIFVRAAGVSPGTSAFFRVGYALPALLLLVLLARGRDPRPWSERGIGIAAGLFFAVDLNFWHRSIDYIGAGLATVLGNLQVVLVALLAWMIHRERPTPAAMVAVPLAFLGLALTTGLGRGDAYGSNPVLGAIFGAGTALAYTGYLLLLRRSARRQGPAAAPLLDATFGAAVGCLAMGLLFDPQFELLPTWPAHGWLLGLALGSHTFGWVLITRALPRLPALETSVLLLVQPTLTMAWGVLLFDEAPSVLQWIGVLLVLGGVALVSWLGAAKMGEKKTAGGGD